MLFELLGLMFFARVNIENPIKINTKSFEKITNYDLKIANCHNELIREAFEITILKNEMEGSLCSDMAHTIIDNRWFQKLEERVAKKRDKK